MSKPSILNSFTILKTSVYTLVASIFEGMVGVSVESRGLLVAVVVAAVCLAVEVFFEFFEYVWSVAQKWYQKIVLRSQINELREFQGSTGSESDNFQEIDVEIKRLQREMTALIAGRNN